MLHSPARLRVKAFTEMRQVIRELACTPSRFHSWLHL